MKQARPIFRARNPYSQSLWVGGSVYWGEGHHHEVRQVMMWNRQHCLDVAFPVTRKCYNLFFPAGDQAKIPAWMREQNHIYAPYTSNFLRPSHGNAHGNVVWWDCMFPALYLFLSSDYDRFLWFEDCLAFPDILQHVAFGEGDIFHAIWGGKWIETCFFSVSRKGAEKLARHFYGDSPDRVLEDAMMEFVKREGIYRRSTAALGRWEDQKQDYSRPDTKWRWLTHYSLPDYQDVIGGFMGVVYERANECARPLLPVGLQVASGSGYSNGAQAGNR